MLIVTILAWDLLYRALRKRIGDRSGQHFSVI